MTRRAVEADLGAVELHAARRSPSRARPAPWPASTCRSRTRRRSPGSRPSRTTRSMPLRARTGVASPIRRDRGADDSSFSRPSTFSGDRRPAPLGSSRDLPPPAGAPIAEARRRARMRRVAGLTRHRQDGNRPRDVQRPGSTWAQRAAKPQPAGRARADATCPGMGTSGACRLSRPSDGQAVQQPARVGVTRVRRTPAGSSPPRRARRAYMTPIRSQTRTTVPRLWLMKRTDVPWRRRSSRTRSSTAASTVTSRPVVGSSMISSAGSAMRAMAMTMRCCWPPESWCG